MNPEALIAYYLFVATIIYPAVRIFRRAGQGPFPAALLFVPYVGLTLAVAHLALRPWPSKEVSS